MKFLPNIILNFHAIHNIVWFESLLKTILRLYNPVSYEEVSNYYLEGKSLKHACHLTFDDGHISFYEKVFPLLQKYNVPVSIFVSPKIVTERSNFWFQEISDYDFKILNEIVDKYHRFENAEKIPVKAKLKHLKINEIWRIIEEYQRQTATPIKACVNMNLEQLKELQQSGLVHVGAHTMNHPILKNEDDQSVEYEISTSIQELSKLLNTSITSFAYPNGKQNFDFGQREIQILANNNIKLAFSTEERPFRVSDDHLAVPRSGFEGGSKVYVYAKLILIKQWGLLKKISRKKGEIAYREFPMQS